MELRKSISSYLKEFCAMYVRPEQIIIGAGTEYLYSILIQLLGRNVCYGVENPGYPKIAKIYRSMGVSMSILIWMKRELLQRNWKKKSRYHAYFPISSFPDRNGDADQQEV